MLRCGDREYRVRGVAKNLSDDMLNINLRVMGVNAYGDMALARRHAGPVRGASARGVREAGAEELGIKKTSIGRDLGRVLLKLEELQDEQIRQALAPKEAGVTMTEEERAAALELLRDRTSWSASSRTSRGAAWSARRPTSWSAIWRRCRGSSKRRWR